MPAPSKFSAPELEFLKSKRDLYNKSRHEHQKKVVELDVGDELLERWPVSLPENWEPPPSRSPSPIPEGVVDQDGLIPAEGKGVVVKKKPSILKLTLAQKRGRAMTALRINRIRVS